MIVNIQKPIQIINNCGCIVDEEELVKAILWYSGKPVARIKTITIHVKYPTEILPRKGRKKQWHLNSFAIDAESRLNISDMIHAVKP